VFTGVSFQNSTLLNAQHNSCRTRIDPQTITRPVPLVPGAKKFGETPFGGRFAHPESYWCYAHQTAPTGKPFGILSMFHAQGIGSLFQSQAHSTVRL
jgi:hypothetical protein